MADQPKTAEAVLATIRSRGYWHVQLRPTTFEKQRVPAIVDLEHAVRRARVELRGWDYPHVSQRDGIARHGDYIQGVVSWQTHHEVWRLFQSGQFVHVFAMREDWLVDYPQYDHLQPGQLLEVTDTLWTLTEVFLFCSRLVEALGLTGDLVLLYGLIGLEGRQLQTLDVRRVPLMESRKAAADLHEFGDALTVPAETLIGAAADLAVEQALQLYARFHWQPDRPSVVEEQRKLLERRF
jgi:hypothetical protein